MAVYIPPLTVTEFMMMRFMRFAAQVSAIGLGDRRERRTQKKIRTTKLSGETSVTGDKLFRHFDQNQFKLGSKRAHELEDTNAGA